MRPVTDARELQQAEQAFRRVFGKASYIVPFNSYAPARLLLYPIDFTMLDRKQYDALATASLRAGVDCAYLAGHGGEEAPPYGYHAVDLPSYRSYGAAVSGVDGLEHFLFAADGQWGVVTSDGLYAIVGGAPTIIADFRKLVGYDETTTQREFLSHWTTMARHGAATNWVPSLLDHVLGQGRGTTLWRDVHHR